MYNTYHERSCSIIVPALKNLFSAVSTHGHFRQLSRGPTSIGAHANLCTLCCVKHVVLMLKHWFCWKYQYNTSKYMFNFIDHLHYYSCVCRGSSALICLGPIMLLRRPWPCSVVVLVRWRTSIKTLFLYFRYFQINILLSSPVHKAFDVYLRFRWKSWLWTCAKLCCCINLLMWSQLYPS